MTYDKIIKNQTKVIIISVIVLVVILLGSSYALFMQVNESTNLQVVESGTLVMEYQKGTTMTTTMVPISDEEGLALTGYSFSVRNTGTLSSHYIVNIYNNQSSSNLVPQQYIKVSIDNSTPVLLSSLSNTTDTASETDEMKIKKTVYDAYLDVGAVVTHNIKVWITEDAPTSIIGKTFALDIDVISEVGFEPPYADASGAATPVLPSGMVPILYNDSKEPVVADKTKEWYDYDAHEWANAVLVDSDTYRNAAPGTVIPEDNILQYYVWIPRYRYLLWNAENGSSDEQMIDIKFEDKTTPKSTGSTNGTWLTHPAFTFGDEELNGIWVGKFENSTSDASCQGVSETAETCNKSTLPVTIKPNQSSWVYINVSNQFASIQGIGTTNASSFGLTSSEVDTHMMKNMEWGAVAYLTSSIYGRYTSASTCIDSGCEVWINNVKNNSSNYASTTGCAGASVSAAAVTSATCPSGYDWTTLGVNASTTGNQYGIYDMSGGSWESVMGNMVDSSGHFYSQSAGFGSVPDAKYYDLYAYGTSMIEHARGHLGDATKETLKQFGGEYGGWYGNYARLPIENYHWSYRGGDMRDGIYAGISAMGVYTGASTYNHSFRSIIVLK